MFVCSAGMSTSLLVEKIKKTAVEKNIEINIYAVGEAEARKDLKQAQILMLGPQVKYLEKSFRAALAGSGVKFGVMSMLEYGRLDSDAILNQIIKLSKEAGL